MAPETATETATETVEEPPTITRPTETPPTDTSPVVARPATRQPASAGAGLLSSARTTLGLVIAGVLLVGVAAGESWYLWLRDEPVVSSSRPVVTGLMAHRAAVEAAQQDIEQILSTSYKTYDAEVDEATSAMTDPFAAKYRETAEEIEEEFVAARTSVQSLVVGAGVIRASDKQVEALLFINQAVTKKGENTAFSQYRVRMTMVHTDNGWLVSDIETK